MALDERHALVTGGSRGIGRGIALALADNRVKVAVHYYQNEAAAKATLAEVRKRGSDGVLIQADVTRHESVTGMFRRMKTDFGKLDIFVSNARPEVPEFFQSPLEISLKQWDTAFDSQAKAFLVGVREALPLMGSGGRIFAITYAAGSRTGGLQPWVGMGSAKAALESLVRYFARRRRQARHYRERDQPRLDGRQRPEYAARAGPATHPQLARTGLDPDGSPGNTRRCWQRGGALLFGEGRLDHRTGDSCGRWRIFDESRGAARDPARIAMLPRRQ
jgi:enoyl-[acyl-carrier-protein] reductase (NADH)